MPPFEVLLSAVLLPTSAVCLNSALTDSGMEAGTTFSYQLMLEFIEHLDGKV